MKLFHPRGPQVTLPVIDLTPAGSLANIAAFLDAGWLLTAPGLEEGEEKETVGFVLRSTHERDGEVTPFLLLYSSNDALKWSFLKVYLNNDDDVAAFEYAAKAKLESFPEYVGNDKPQRGASGKTDRFIVPVARPFGVVFKKNPKHGPAETDATKKKPARLFVRWADQRPAAGEATPAETTFAAHSRAIAASLTLESLKQAFSEACKDTRLTTVEVASLTRLKDDRKAGMTAFTGPRGELFPHGQNVGAAKG